MATPFPFTSGQTLTAAQMNAITTLPSTTKIASHTLVIADQGTRVIMNSASATSVTVDTSIFGANDIVEIQNIGAGVCTVTAGSATVSSAGPLAIPQFGGGQLFFTSAGVSIFFPTAVTATASGVVQVKSVFKADAFTMTGTTYTDVTGLSVSITPTSASNKILCMGQINTSIGTDTEQVFGQLLRTSTVIGNGTGGTNINFITSGGVADDGGVDTTPIFFVDSPATTSATTYKIQIKASGAGVIALLNRRGLDTALGGSSSLILMEVTP